MRDGILERRTFLMGSVGMGLTALTGAALSGCASGVPVDDGPAPSEEQLSAPAEPAPEPVPAAAAPVFFMREISSAGLMRAWEALGVQPVGNVAAKLSIGEPGGRNFLQPSLVADLVHRVGGTIVECNTAYGGARSTTERHLQAAADHGFTAVADMDVMDADGSMSLPVEGGRHLTEDLVGAHLADYDYVVSLAHFKGHAMGGFGGALKNCSIGIASREGKVLIHSAGASTTSWGSPAQDDFLESMAEAAKAVADYLPGRMAYVNVMNRLSVDCDCGAHPAEPVMADIGILASLDPVALDRACVDLVHAAADGASLVERMESRNGAHILEHAEALGLGSQAYKLVDLDEEERGEPMVNPPTRIRMTLDGTSVEAVLDDGEAARAFAALLPLALSMRELNGNEKFAKLDAPLPASASAPGRIEAGDLMLYGSDTVVLFYESFDTAYSYTRLGRVGDTSALAAIAAAPRVEITFETL